MIRTAFSISGITNSGHQVKEMLVINQPTAMFTTSHLGGMGVLCPFTCCEVTVGDRMEKRHSFNPVYFQILCSSAGNPPHYALLHAPA